MWGRARPISGKDPRLFRKDVDGNEIRWEQYGNRGSASGWEIHEIGDVSKGGGGSPRNLVALHWRINANLGRAVGNG